MFPGPRREPRYRPTRPKHALLLLDDHGGVHDARLLGTAGNPSAAVKLDFGAMTDFLTFDTMISRHALLIFYYLGALVMPVAAWLVALYLIRRFNSARAIYEAGMGLFAATVPLRWRLLGLVLFVAAFLFMELMWRMMFEYLIAFMQMRDALVGG
jgi:hypothetical protein